MVFVPAPGDRRANQGLDRSKAYDRCANRRPGDWPALRRDETLGASRIRVVSEYRRNPKGGISGDRRGEGSLAVQGPAGAIGAFQVIVSLRGIGDASARRIVCQ